MSWHWFAFLVFGLVGALLLGTAGAEPDAQFGTAHATIVDFVDPEGRWMVLCQARTDTNGDGKVESFFDRHHGTAMGDEVRPYLVQGGGPGKAIDDYVQHDWFGRWLVVIRDGKLTLIDTRSRKEWDLSKTGARTDDADPVFGPHSAASFDAAGRQLLYTRAKDDGVVVVVRDLATHAESVIEPGPGVFHRAWIDPAGHHVLLQVVAADTSGNGKLERPEVGSSLAERTCRGAFAAYSVFGRTGDVPVLRVAPTSGGKAVDVDGLIAPVGRDLLVRTDDDALHVQTPDGKRRRVAPASARAALYRRAASGAFVLVHRGEGKRGPLWLHHAGKGVKLPSEGVAEHDRNTFLLRRWWALEPETSAHVVADLLKGIFVRVEGRVLHTHGDAVLLERDSGLVVRQMSSGKERAVAGGGGESGRTLRRGPAIAKDGVVVHLEDPSKGGRFEGEPYNLTTDGRVLLAAREGHGMPIGPFRWVRPTPE
ncbi:MAG: hypothetical protein QNJ98_11890 [Planctomycetota bacterium]|nr:hypothetical protein [Planctomycetota bacterium]